MSLDELIHSTKLSIGKRVWVMLLLILAIIWAGIAYTLIYGYTQRVQQMEHVSLNLVRSLAAHTTATLDNLRWQLQSLEQALQQKPTTTSPDPQRYKELLEQQTATTAMISALYLFNAEGSEKQRLFSKAIRDNAMLVQRIAQWASTERLNSLKQAALKEDTAELYLAQPVSFSDGQQWFLPIIHRVEDQASATANYLLLLLDLSYFRQFYEQFELTPLASVALVHRQGYFLVRVPYKALFFGRRFTDDTFFSEKLPSLRFGVFRTQKSIDHRQRLIAFQNLAAYPLAVVVTQGLRPGLAQWRNTRLLLIFIGLIASLFLLLFARSIAEGAKQLAEHHDLLEEVVAKRTENLQQNLQDVQESEELYRSLFTGCKAAEILIDPQNGQIVDANPAALNYYGYSREQITQMCIYEINQLSADETKAEMARAKTERRNHFFFRHKLANGEVRDVEVHSGPLAIHGKQLLYSIIHDITDRRQAEMALKQARLDAEKASKAKSEFLASMSHEIRTPLNIVIGLGDVLKEWPMPGEQRQLVEKIQMAGSMLLELISNILDLARIEAGQITLEVEPIDLHALLNEITAVLEVGAQERGLHLKLQMHEGVPQWVKADSQRLRQVLMNLFGNALKFTEEGGWIVLEVSQEGPEETHFRVSDTGIGIDAQHLSEIFEAFSQADSGITRRFGGTGLGLTICRRLIAMMGGGIQVESTVGKGSCFFFTLPLVKTSATLSEAHHPHAAAPPPQLHDHRMLDILLVEDSPDNQMLIKTYLKGQACHLQIVENGALALEAIQQQSYDLILMDIQMPVMDGLTATREIRRWEAETVRPPIPILALTAHALKEDREIAFSAGCNAYLTKPIKKIQLLLALRAYGPEL
uniref:histidine kinase n=1 Tax=Magnetococcus massalia (strain MO-1) TaxID=451514 RepID=A0A1S7LN86_MAGMO|nr:putative histidine kinase with PAS and response regulator receiver domains [Candidatus Magnetococcus massalia]